MNDDTDTPTLDGPPEPVVLSGDDIRLVYPSDDGRDIQDTKLGTWECQQCGVSTVMPILNGVVQEPPQCDGCEKRGPFKHRALDDYPDIAPSTFANPQWYAPDGISDEGFADLWADIRDWLYTNWVAGEDEEYLYDGLTAFAISTWLRPNLNFLPQLMVMGKHETGKTRLLTTLARVSYRGRVPVSFTPAAVFRTIDKYNITLFLSEYHDLNADLRDEMNAVIKGSQKRGEDVMRTEKGPNGGYEPADFDIFTHVAIGTQFDPPDDIVSRCIQVTTKPADRDVPVWFDEEQATDLRNRLLYARYRLLEPDTEPGEENTDPDPTEWEQAEQAALEWLTDRDVTGRLREKLLSLVTVAVIWDERDSLEPFVDAMVEEAKEAATDSDDALFIQAVRDLAFDELGSKQVLGDADPWDDITIPISDARDRFNDLTGRDVKSRYIGQIRDRLGLEKKRHSDGVVISDPNLREKLENLCKQNNLEWEHSGYHDPIEELDEQVSALCSECGEEQWLKYRHKGVGSHLCEDCADAEREIANAE